MQMRPDDQHIFLLEKKSTPGMVTLSQGISVYLCLDTRTF